MFGAGKSYLLSVIIQFISSVLEMVDKGNSDSLADGAASMCQSKVLVASMTNVAVDRVLLRFVGFVAYLLIV